MRKLAYCVLLAGFVASAGGIFASPDKSGGPVQDLIDQLDSERYADRESAEKALRALEVVPPELVKACRSSKLEIRTRAKAIVTAVEGRFTSLMLREIEQLVRDGDFDQAIERAVRWEGIDSSGKNVIPFAASMERLRDAEKRLFGKLGKRKKLAESRAIENQLIPGAWRVKLKSSSTSLGIVDRREVSGGAVLRAAGVSLGLEGGALLFIVSSKEVRWFDVTSSGEVEAVLFCRAGPSYSRVTWLTRS